MQIAQVRYTTTKPRDCCIRRSDTRLTQNYIVFGFCSYPLAEDQHISVGWEEAVVELAADILVDPFGKRY